MRCFWPTSHPGRYQKKGPRQVHRGLLYRSLITSALCYLSSSIRLICRKEAVRSSQK